MAGISAGGSTFDQEMTIASIMVGSRNRRGERAAGAGSGLVREGKRDGLPIDFGGRDDSACGTRSGMVTMAAGAAAGDAGAGAGVGLGLGSGFAFGAPLAFAAVFGAGLPTDFSPDLPADLSTGFSTALRLFSTAAGFRRRRGEEAGASETADAAFCSRMKRRDGEIRRQFSRAGRRASGPARHWRRSDKTRLCRHSADRSRSSSRLASGEGCGRRPGWPKVTSITPAASRMGSSFKV